MNYQDLKKYQEFYEGSIDEVRKTSMNFIFYFFRHHGYDLYASHMKRIFLNKFELENVIALLLQEIFERTSENSTLKLQRPKMAKDY